MKRLLVVAALAVAGCAFLNRAATNVAACQESDPTTLARLLDALANAAEQQWLAAAKAIEPNEDTLRCDLAGIVSAEQNPDGGFVYVLSDGGVVAPNRLTSAAQLGETSHERVVRRARTYFALTQ